MAHTDSLDKDMTKRLRGYEVFFFFFFIQQTETAERTMKSPLLAAPTKLIERRSKREVDIGKKFKS